MNHINRVEDLDHCIYFLRKEYRVSYISRYSPFSRTLRTKEQKNKVPHRNRCANNINTRLFWSTSWMPWKLFWFFTTWAYFLDNFYIRADQATFFIDILVIIKKCQFFSLFYHVMSWLNIFIFRGLNVQRNVYNGLQ